MKLRYSQSNIEFPSQAPARGYSRVMLPLILALLIFFLLPGLLAAQETGEPQEQSTEATAVSLNDQAVAAAIAAAQPGAMTDTPVSLELSRELRPERLWLLPRHAEFTDLLNRAGRQALQHPDCNEVLYGSLNEFKTERIGTSFTILCMKDARTTFNQVFFADDLLSEEELAAAEEPDGSDELERLRQMMEPSGQPDAPTSLELLPDDLPAPTVF